MKFLERMAANSKKHAEAEARAERARAAAAEEDSGDEGALQHLPERKEAAHCTSMLRSPCAPSLHLSLSAYATC